jgi:hypothetical protein
MEVAGYFELDAGKAREIAAQVGNAVSKWRAEAARHGLTKQEMDRMASTARCCAAVVRLTRHPQRVAAEVLKVYAC